MAVTAINSKSTDETNLEILHRDQPDLAQLIRGIGNSSEFQVVPSKTESPTLIWISPEGRETSLHSRYNPLDEATRLINDIPTGSSTNFLILGFGLGFHVAELISKIPPTSRVLVVESQPQIIRLALKLPHMREILEFPRIKFYLGPEWNPDRFENIFETWCDGFTLNGFTPVRFNSVTRPFDTFYNQFETHLAQKIKQTQVAHNTRRALSRILYLNTLENLDKLIQSLGVDQLKNSAKGQAAVIVGAGPSLDKNIHLIKGAGNRALVIAVSTAFKSLIRAGIDPDFVVAIDPKNVSFSAFSDSKIPESTRLIFDPAIPSQIIDLFPNRHYAVDSHLQIWKHCCTVLTPKGDLGTSSSVAHTALFLARHLGCDPVILAGQDLAWSGTRSHCSGSYHLENLDFNTGSNYTGHDLRKNQQEHSSAALQTSRDLFGRSVSTSSALESFRHPYEQGDSVTSTIINATEGGITLQGIKETTLKEALALLKNKTNITLGLNHEEAVSPQKKHQFELIIRERIENFENLSGKINLWLSKPKPIHELEFKNRCEESEKLLEALVEDEIGIHTLQEFLYSEFLDWNQETAKIELEQVSCEQTKLKFNRDHTLLINIVQAIEKLNMGYSALLKSKISVL